LLYWIVLASKMSAKKIIRSLNKTNAKKFSKHLLDESTTEVRIVELCETSITDGTLRCAIGEAYVFFINSNLDKVLKIHDEKFAKYTDWHGGANGAAIDALVKAANVKKGFTKRQLGEALSEVMSNNDNADNMLDRVRLVVGTWNSKVVPLLK
jgi:hypothetical protein